MVGGRGDVEAGMSWTREERRGLGWGGGKTRSNGGNPYQSIVPSHVPSHTSHPCVWALSWYDPPTHKNHLRRVSNVALPLAAPSCAEQPPAEPFWRGRAGGRLPCRLDEGAENTPQHGGCGCCCCSWWKRRCRSLGLPEAQIPEQRQRKKKYFFSFFCSFFSLLRPAFHPTSLSARQASRQAGAQHEWVLTLSIHTQTLTLMGLVLCLSHFLSVGLFMRHCDERWLKLLLNMRNKRSPNNYWIITE